MRRPLSLWAAAFFLVAQQWDDDFFAWLDQCQREDAPFLYDDAPAELSRQPVRGKGGKPTGKFLPTGKESLKQLQRLHGENDMRKPSKQKTNEMPAVEGDQTLARRQEQAAAAILAPLDALATEMERKWGVGRLETLVPPEWAEKFDSAFHKLNLAIAARDLAALRERAEIMMRGWRKLDELATAAGHEPWQSADVWEVQSPAGRVYAICRRPVDEKNMARYDGVRILSLDDVARIIDAWDADGFVTELRAQFPGSYIAKAAKIAPDDRPDAGI